MVNPIGSTVLPGTPSEVLWALTEVASTLFMKEGTAIVEEGELNDDIFIVTGGIVSIECKLGWANGAPRVKVVGRLRTGAVLGDICMMGAQAPHMATVRAMTTAQVLHIP